MVITRKQANELLEYLRKKLEIPNQIKSLDLRLSVDDITTITCEYYPEFKEEK